MPISALQQPRLQEKEVVLGFVTPVDKVPFHMIADSTRHQRSGSRLRCGAELTQKAGGKSCCWWPPTVPSR